MRPLTRGSILRMGIGSKAFADRHRHDPAYRTNRLKEVSA